MRHIDLLREAVRGVRQRYPFHIDAWVVLPDHLHCIWTLSEGAADFSTRWRLIKTAFAKALPVTERRSAVRMTRHESQGQGRVPERQRSWLGPKAALLGALRMQRAIWQRRFWEHAIRDQRDYARHVDYIHDNPVKHGYVTRVVEWPHSTFHRYVERGIYPPNWAGAPESECEAGERV